VRRAANSLRCVEPSPPGQRLGRTVRSLNSHLRQRWHGAVLAGAALLGCLAAFASHSRIVTAQTSTIDDVQAQYVMFYHPPRDGTSTQTMAVEAKAVIFTNGDEAHIRQMRAYGFSGPALEYIMANEASGPPDLINSSSECAGYLFYPNNLSGLAGDFCAALHP